MPGRGGREGEFLGEFLGGVGVKVALEAMRCLAQLLFIQFQKQYPDVYAYKMLEKPHPLLELVSKYSAKSQRRF